MTAIGAILFLGVVAVGSYFVLSFFVGGTIAFWLMLVLVVALFFIAIGEIKR